MRRYGVIGFRTRKIHIEFIQSSHAIGCNVNKKPEKWSELRVYQNIYMQRIVYIGKIVIAL